MTFSRRDFLKTGLTLCHCTVRQDWLSGARTTTHHNPEPAFYKQPL